jgi:hypothetical protein
MAIHADPVIAKFYELPGSQVPSMRRPAPVKSVLLFP